MGWTAPSAGDLLPASWGKETVQPSGLWTILDVRAIVYSVLYYSARDRIPYNV
jgi:hypothetical protein